MTHIRTSTLPKVLQKPCLPKPATKPTLVCFNDTLLNDSGLITLQWDRDRWLSLLSGQSQAPECEPVALAYSGHQFGHFNQLGDGRAHLLCEFLSTDDHWHDLQLKGSGQTPFSRRGDGLAALGPMLREYLISEAMHHLRLPTTRSLAVISTGEPVYREYMEPGAILARTASSHIRVGTFQHVAAYHSATDLKALADYTIQRHYPELMDHESPYLAMLSSIQEKQIKLITEWLRVGFIHGVMNTDNMAVSGETIDYGPCAFMDTYDPLTCFSSIDRDGRYAFMNQPIITQWNLARLAEACLPLISDNKATAIDQATDLLNQFPNQFEVARIAMMCGKLGITDPDQDDQALIDDLLILMHTHKVDYTECFEKLGDPQNHKTYAPFQHAEFESWLKQWHARLSTSNTTEQQQLMRTHNPSIIPRNHQVESALESAVQEQNYDPFYELLDAVRSPYNVRGDHLAFKVPPKPSELVTATYCGT